MDSGIVGTAALLRRILRCSSRVSASGATPWRWAILDLFAPEAAGAVAKTVAANHTQRLVDQLELRVYPENFETCVNLYWRFVLRGNHAAAA